MSQDLSSQGLRTYSFDGRFKVSAAALIQAAGLVGIRSGGVRVSPKHALVFENVGEATLADIQDLAARVREAVHTQFGVQLEMEPQGYVV